MRKVASAIFLVGRLTAATQSNGFGLNLSAFFALAVTTKRNEDCLLVLQHAGPKSGTTISTGFNPGRPGSTTQTKLCVIRIILNNWFAAGWFVKVNQLFSVSSFFVYQFSEFWLLASRPASVGLDDDYDDYDSRAACNSFVWGRRRIFQCLCFAKIQFLALRR
ncbi:MAG TPA: hypothetical protein PLK30_02195 [Blastocatellia bacterium]|nr:hypothetical protein [Blastocatellia bacterium]